MGNFTRKNCGGFSLCYEEKFYDKFDEDYYDDPSEYIPKIGDTELEAGLAFWGSNYFPLLTSRVSDGKRKYYLFDFYKSLAMRRFQY